MNKRDLSGDDWDWSGGDSGSTSAYQDFAEDKSVLTHFHRLHICLFLYLSIIIVRKC